MTGDLSEPAHGAAQQAYEAAARLYEQAAAELDQAAAHCRVAATHFRGAEVPRGAAHAWAALGISARQNCGWRNRLVPTASRRASRVCFKSHSHSLIAAMCTVAR
jgi:L-lactate utilization protein LutC